MSVYSNTVFSTFFDLWTSLDFFFPKLNWDPFEIPVLRLLQSTYKLAFLGHLESSQMRGWKTLNYFVLQRLYVMSHNVNDSSEGQFKIQYIFGRGYILLFKVINLHISQMLKDGNINWSVNLSDGNKDHYCLDSFNVSVEFISWKQWCDIHNTFFVTAYFHGNHLVLHNKALVFEAFCLLEVDFKGL